MIMRTSIFILSVLICCLFSCKSSSQTGKGRQSVDTFTKIASSAGIDVYFTQENSHTVEIIADDDIYDKIEVKVENGTLVLKRKDGTSFPKRRNISIKAYVSAKELKSLAFSGGADFSAENLKCGKLSIAASGGSDVEINKLDASECSLAFSGGADCEIGRLEASKVSLAFSGGSDGEIYIVKAASVSASASGGADLTLKGKVDNLSINVSGGADADIRELKCSNISSNKSGGGGIRK